VGFILIETHSGKKVNGATKSTLNF